MPALSVFSKTLRDLRWQVFWYGAGLALMAALVVVIYPSYRDQLADFEIPEALQGLIGDADYASPEGYLTAEFVSWVPIITVIFAIMAGTSALAGEEAAGTMDLLLSQPISRRRLAVEKIAAILVATVAITAITCLGWVSSVPFVDIDIDMVDLFTASLNVVPITLTFAFMAMWAGAAMPDRRGATGIVTGVAVLGYFVNYLAQLVDVLRPVAWASPFHYYGLDILTAGFDLWKTLALVGLAAGFAIGAVRSFERRDIGVRSTSHFPSTLFRWPHRGRVERAV